MSAVKRHRLGLNKRKKIQRPAIQKVGVRRFSSVLIVLSFCIFSLWSYFHAGTVTTILSSQIEEGMACLGFALEDVVVEGRMRTDQEQILTTLGLTRGVSLFSINISEAKTKLENLSWIKAARVERRLPDTLFIRISEKEPVALWQNQNKLYLVDSEGELVETKETSKYKQLMVVAGHYAPKHVKELLTLLEKFPEIRARVTTATHLRSMRWDIKLDNKMDIRLPEKDAERALERLVELENHHQVMEREIMTIDMRLPGQLILRLTPEAIQKRNHLGKDA